VHSPNGNFAIRRGDWKYIEGQAAPGLKKIARRDELGVQLYNLKDDPAEQNNGVSQNPDVAKDLLDLLNEQRSSGRSQ
jgi:arylsulfatase A-like enzyme